LTYQSAASGKSTFGSVVGTDFDLNAQLRMSAGTLNVSASTFTNSGSRPSVVITGGDARIDGSWIFDGASSAQPTITVSNFSSSLIVSDTAISRGAGVNISENFVDRTLVQASSAGNVRLETLAFRGLSSGTLSPTLPVISLAQSRGSVLNSFIYETGATTPGVFVQVTGDNWVNVIGNQFMGWKMVLPATSNYITARLNNGLGAGSSAQRDALF
jgi:hypothetical protein